MSNLLRKRRPATGETEFKPSSSKRQRFADATRTLLDIANESADALPPLKSCLGGINALVKYYEGCKDVEEKLGELVLWLAKLKDRVTTTTADDNREEAERRGQLTSSLSNIEQRSRVLLDKGKVSKILDKKQDSGIIVRLVEELRQAILIYQLSQQQSIDNQVTQLASSFNSFLKLHKSAPGIKEKIESSLARLDRLTAGGSTFADESESKRKVILFEALEGIKEELRPILDRSDSVGYKENDGDVRAMCELAEDATDAIMEYQLAQQTGIYEQNCRLIDSADLSVLNNCRRTKGAEYCHGNRRGCLKGTRNTVLKEIESWAMDFDKSPVFWLNGLAGTGKSTIAQTVAERLFAEGNLGASFFCSRNFEDSSNLHFIFPTLAFQLAHKYHDFRSHFVSLLRSNPDVVYQSLYSQMQKLIAEPLRKTGISTVIVIDALDECKDDEPSSAILSVLGRFVEEISKVKFFITGRPEPRIKTGFRLPLLSDSTDVFVLHDVHPSLIENDIRIFLKHDLSELAQRRQLEGWPSDELVELLCRRAAGLFVYAVATIKFLDSNTHLPEHRLDVILKLPESTVPEGKTRFDSRTTLDSLYTSIFQAAFSEEDPDVDSKVRTTVGTIVMVVNPLPPPAIAELIGLEPKEVTLYLTLIQSLLVIGEDPVQPVKPFHKSFPDFIVDPSRCVEKRFCISPERLHFELATNCLRLMNNLLEQDLLSLPEYTLNSEIGDLQTRIDGRVSIALRYACRSWHHHLTESRGEITDIIPYLRIFLETKFLAWLEVLSVLGEIGTASLALEKLALWLREVAKDGQLLDIAQDYFHFVTKFFEPINISATHIYHSALEWCPISSIVRKLYYDRYHDVARFPRVMVGIPDSWDPTVSFSGKDDYHFCTWSPCGRFVAAQTNKTVEVRNQLTFELLTILKTEGTSQPTGPLTYSPDGRSLACGISGAIVIWDIQTGGVAKEIEFFGRMGSLVWSSDGMTIAITPDDGDSIQGTRRYDVASGAQLYTEAFNFGPIYQLWAYEKTFRFLTVESCHEDSTIKISTFEIGPTLIELESLTVAMTPAKISTVTFSPSVYRVSLLVYDTLRILDVRNSGCLLEERGNFTSPQFSSDGSLFAAFHRDGFRVWTFTHGIYVLWKEFLFPYLPNSSRYHPSLYPCLLFPPSSPSILSRCWRVLHVWRLHHPPATPKTIGLYAAVSRSGSHIATAHDSESTVAITGPHSQTPSQFIDTGVEIKGLAITGNVLSVMSSGKVVAWLLTEGGKVDGVSGKRAGRDDSIWSLSSPSRHCKFWVYTIEDQVGEITTDDVSPFVYHTETGKVLEHAHESQPFGRPWVFYQLTDGRACRHRYYRDPSQHDRPPEGGWLHSLTLAQEAGWVIDPQGRHRFWVPVEWRKFLDPGNWHHDITALFNYIVDQPIIIKF